MIIQVTGVTVTVTLIECR